MAVCVCAGSIIFFLLYPSITASAVNVLAPCHEVCVDNTNEDPALYCQMVERVAQRREDEHPWLTEDMKHKISQLRPAHLMGKHCASDHPLKEWMILEMGLVMRKQVCARAARHILSASHRHPRLMRLAARR